MRLRRLAPALLALLALLAVAPRGAAEAPPLGGAWFKVTVKLKGAAVSPENVAEKAAGSVVVYMFVEGVPSVGDPSFPGTPYAFTIVSETAPFEWSVTDAGQFRLSGQDGEVMTALETGPANRGVEFDLVVPDEDATQLTVCFVAAMKAKADGEGALKKATFKSVGGMVVEGFGDGDLLVGGAKVKGASVPEAALPFDPDSLEE